VANEKGLKKNCFENRWWILIIYLNGVRLTHGIIPICHVAFLSFGQNKFKSIFR
jgi:hypothetical protein